MPARIKLQHLSCSKFTSQFIICLIIIPKYSSQLKHVTNKLKSKSQDLCSVQNYVQDLLVIFKYSTVGLDVIFNGIFKKVLNVPEK